jgi:hypothetical protein
MKEELYVFINGERKQLDLENPSGITMKWVSNLFNDLSKLTCSYTYTFNLPKTNNNVRVLENVCDIRHKTDIRHAVVEAEFLINGICLCKNANLHLSEIKADSFSCVLTWGVLKAFIELKDSGVKLNELPSLGTMIWQENGYGWKSAFLTNMETYVTPLYVAGNPNKPGKPCIPVYRLIQEINKFFGVKFELGRLLRDSFGALSESCFNNTSYHGEIHNDDFITYGAIPLTGNDFNGGTYNISANINTGKTLTLYALGSGGLYVDSNRYERDWVQGVWSRGMYGNETCFLRLADGQDAIPSREPLAYSIPVVRNLSYNNIVQPLYAKCEDNSYEAFMIEQEERRAYLTEWLRNHQYWEETVKRAFYFEAHNSFINGKRNEYQSIGYRCIFEHEVVGSLKLHVKKEAVDARRVSLTEFRWISIGKVSKSNAENGNQYWIRSIDVLSSNNVDSWAGLQSYGSRIFDQATNTYVYTFDFGDELIARKLNMPAADSDLIGYFFLPYIPEMETANDVLRIQEGDLYITDLHITRIAPILTFTGFPVKINITQSLPNISVYDFMRSLFALNGAYPVVDADGETIKAIYYDNLKRAIMNGEGLDWSDKLIGDIKTNTSTKFLPKQVAQHNYFKNANTTYGKTESELLEEFDEYPQGYGDIQFEDTTLSENKDIYKSPFYSPLLLDRRYPSVETGETTKIWNGVGEYQDTVNPIYGYVLYENERIRLKCFDPFDNIENFYGYLQKIYDDYVQIKETFLLNEMDLLKLDFGKPIYLSKYNAYFAISTLQRNKGGDCVAELVKLPSPEEEDAGIVTADMYGNLEKQEPSLTSEEWLIYALTYAYEDGTGAKIQWKDREYGAWQDSAYEDVYVSTTDNTVLYFRIKPAEVSEEEEETEGEEEANELKYLYVSVEGMFKFIDSWGNVKNAAYSCELSTYIDGVLKETYTRSGQRTIQYGERAGEVEVDSYNENVLLPQKTDSFHPVKIIAKMYSKEGELLTTIERNFYIYY